MVSPDLPPTLRQEPFISWTRDWTLNLQSSLEDPHVPLVVIIPPRQTCDGVVVEAWASPRIESNTDSVNSLERIARQVFNDMGVASDFYRVLLTDLKPPDSCVKRLSRFSQFICYSAPVQNRCYLEYCPRLVQSAIAGSCLNESIQACVVALQCIIDFYPAALKTARLFYHNPEYEFTAPAQLHTLAYKLLFGENEYYGISPVRFDEGEQISPLSARSIEDAMRINWERANAQLKREQLVREFPQIAMQAFDSACRKHLQEHTFGRNFLGNVRINLQCLRSCGKKIFINTGMPAEALDFFTRHGISSEGFEIIDNSQIRDAIQTYEVEEVLFIQQRPTFINLVLNEGYSCCQVIRSHHGRRYGTDLRNLRRVGFMGTHSDLVFLQELSLS